MRSDKAKRAMQAYSGHAGAETVSHVMSTIPTSLITKLTGKQVGQVMSIRNAAYHEGKSAAGAEICDDAVWVAGKLIPLAVIAALSHKTATHTEIKSAAGICCPISLCNADGNPLTEGEIYAARQNNNKGAYYRHMTSVTRWTCDYTESV